MGVLLSCLRGSRPAAPPNRAAALFAEDSRQRWVEMGTLNDPMADAEATAARMQTIGLTSTASGRFAAEAFFEVFRPDTDSDEEETARQTQAARERVASSQARVAEQRAALKEEEAARARAQAAAAADAVARAEAARAVVRRGSLHNDVAAIMSGSGRRASGAV